MGNPDKTSTGDLKDDDCVGDDVWMDIVATHRSNGTLRTSLKVDIELPPL